MQDLQFRDSFQPHVDYNQVRPMTNKDLHPLDPAVQSYVRAHAYAVDLKTNRFV